MLLYRYLGAYTADYFDSEKLKASNPNKFNDPFELLFKAPVTLTKQQARSLFKERRNDPRFLSALKYSTPQLTNRARKNLIRNERPAAIQAIVNSHDLRVEKAKKNIKTIADQHLRIICFSKDSISSDSDMLMWAYYANGHNGVRLGFCRELIEKYKFQLTDVEYERERVFVDMAHDPSSAIVEEGIKRSLRVKSRAWVHESEVRMLLSPSSCDSVKMANGDILDFIRIPFECCRRVDFGINLSVGDRSKIVDSITSKTLSHLEVYSAAPHRDDFLINYNRILG